MCKGHDVAIKAQGQGQTLNFWRLFVILGDFSFGQSEELKHKAFQCLLKLSLIQI